MFLEQALAVIAQLKQENAYLRGQLGEQYKHLQEQAKLIELLQARLNQNSSTSSKPPSSDGPGVKRPKKRPTGRKRGGQKGHTGRHRARVPAQQVDVLHRHPLQGPCPHCQCESLKNTQWRFVKQVWELPQVKPTVTEYQVQTGVCVGCGAKREAQLPAQTPRGCLGPNAQAALTTLTGCSAVSRRQTQFLSRNLLGLSVSLGTVSNVEKRVSDSLRKPAKQVRAALRQEPILLRLKTSLSLFSPPKGPVDPSNLGLRFEAWTKQDTNAMEFVVGLG